jgi:hypothetical protein
MILVLRMSMTGQAFAGGENGTEVSRIFDWLSEQVVDTNLEVGTYFVLFDSNGNNVGRVDIVQEVAINGYER